MKNEEFRKYGHELVERIADYFSEIEKYPVMPKVQPGDIFGKLPVSAPVLPESTDDILRDFDNMIMPGLMHWNSPSFHGYFPANNSFPSILAEFLTAGLGAQGMMWQTSPAATELEEKMMVWLRDMIGLTDDFTGVIQDTASTATLIAILTAREKKSEFSVNNDGFKDNKFRVYCSAEAHSSVDKAVKIAGIGRNNLVKIPVDEKFAMKAVELENAIINDKQNGFIPLLVVGAFGTTGSLAIDPMKEIAGIAYRNQLWFHIDAAYLGTAMVVPEFRHCMHGCELADSFVFNPHKWMMTNFDCSAYFVRDKESLIRTFEIMPEYLKTAHDSHVNNYRDWGIQLGRRFRALKLWFVIRTYGIEGIRNKIRNDVSITRAAVGRLKEIKGISIEAPVDFNVICFRYENKNNPLNQDEFNALLLSEINKSGEAFLTHTKLNGKYVIRIVIAQTNVEMKHIEKLTNLIESKIRELDVK